MNLREERTTLNIKVPSSQIEELFQEGEIEKIYDEARAANSAYYIEMIKSLLKEFEEEETIVLFLGNKNMSDCHEMMIKSRLLEQAVAKVISGEKSELRDALKSEVNEDAIARAIYHLEGVISETLRDFCRKRDEDPIFRAGLQYID